MSQRLKKQATVLSVLAKSDPRVREVILKGFDKELLKCITDCAVNILNGNVPLKASEKRALGKHKSKLRRLADKKTSLKKKHQIVQKGGFLPLLLAPLLSSVIAPLAGAAVKGIVKAIKKKKH